MENVTSLQKKSKNKQTKITMAFAFKSLSLQQEKRFRSRLCALGEAMASRLQKVDEGKRLGAEVSSVAVQLPCSWEAAELQRLSYRVHLGQSANWPPVFMFCFACSMARAVFLKKNHGPIYLRGNWAHLLFYR